MPGLRPGPPPPRQGKDYMDGLPLALPLGLGFATSGLLGLGHLGRVRVMGAGGTGSRWVSLLLTWHVWLWLHG